MRIADLKVYSVAARRTNWVFVEVETDEGLTGLGEATNYPGSDLVAAAALRLKDRLVGEDPRDIDRLWQKLFRQFTYLGSRGLVCSLIGAVDIALWDLKGKAVGRPVFDLLGGAHRNPVPLYTHVQGGAPRESAAHARQLVAEGWAALKTDPFHGSMPGFGTNYVNGHISPEGVEKGAEIIAAIREAVGPKIEILIDAHGCYNVASALRVAKALQPYNIGWLEEPLPPESLQALRQVREAAGVPICVGERLFTRWDFAPIFESRAADYIMPDVIRTGGISELRKICTMAEAYCVPVSPHDANGPINILAGSHVMASVPNCYRVELASAGLELYNAVLDRPLEIREGAIWLSDRPGLGVSLNHDYVKAHPADPTPRPGFHV